MSNPVTQWAEIGDDVYSAANTTVQELPPGYYEIERSISGPLFRRQKLITDDLIDFEEALGNKIIKEIQHFWTKADIFKKYGFLHRRGYMLHGPPGSGKTSLIQLIIADTVKRNGLIFRCDEPGQFENGLRQFRIVENKRPIVCMFEDLDGIINNYGDDEVTSLLDGENQVNHVVNVATTNYLKKLDPRIVNRPRRFDRVYEIGMPIEAVRRKYLKGKFPELTTEEVETWSKITKGFSFAGLADLVVSVKCLDVPFQEAVDILKKLMKIGGLRPEVETI